MIAMTVATAQRRVWIYQANRKMQDAEAKEAQAFLDTFKQGWKAHQVKLDARIRVLHHLFVVIEVDEARQEATGCSIDSSVAALRELGKRLDIDFFDRQMLAYEGQEGNIETARLPELAALYQSGVITDDTIVYNNLVDQGVDFDQKWRQPLKASWMARFI